MNRFLIAAGALLILSSVASAQNKPVVKSQIAAYEQFQGAPARSIQLMDYFADPDGSTAVRMDTVLGTMNIVLYGDQKPITVANFLRYVNEGRYFTTDTATGQLASSFIHRSVPGFVIQGGGFIGTTDPSDSTHTRLLPTQVGALPPIQNEPGISNTRGTIAMAKIAEQRDSSGNIVPGTGANSATSQWFINLADNSANLDAQNGGFTAFGRVAGTGMSVADGIAALPKVNAGSPFDALPVRNYTSPNPVRVANLVSIPSVTQISTLNFTATSSNTSVATVAVSGTRLLVSGVGVGSSTISVTATDLDGLTVSQSFTVNVVTAPGRLVNVSTRLQVGTNENVLIAGFIVRGGTSKRLIVRGIGPSSGVGGALANPSLELHDGSGALIASNDNWGDSTNKQEIVDSGVAP
ncbi:MAG: peptidylprolyl isomerase, partial [Verrucomicrobiota bacterium]|nr:peptidylprolyl isomerase [Verrucomicrobiota bacterium]